jgi:hypothetical protein
MRLAAIVLARTIFFVESIELNPRGAAYYPDLVAGFVERYQFKSFPQKLEDFDETKGIVLAGGKLGDKTIDRVTIYNWGLTLDTTSSTLDSEELLIEGLTWATKNLRLTFSPEMIKRKSHVSQIVFYSDAPLLSLNPVFDVVGRLIGKEVFSNLRLPYEFQPNAIRLGIDPEQQRIPIQTFTLERREGAAYSENKYFSAAPLQTNAHFAVIEEFELASLGKAR